MYCETVALLLKLQVNVGESTAKNILSRMNELLTSNRHLETQLQRIGEALDRQPSALLLAERANFEGRLERTDDDAIRAALQQSLSLCDARLSDTKTMGLNLERVSVQQEAVLQALATVKSALTRMELAPTLTSTAVQDISDSVHELTLQTVAVEQAVQEVATIEARGS